MRALRFFRQQPLLYAAFLVRWFVAMRTALPERDGAHYLWLADGVAQGDPARLLHSVFHPLFSLVIGCLECLAPTFDKFRVAQFAATVLSALTVFPLRSIARRICGEPFTGVGRIPVTSWFGLAVGN